MARTTQFIGNPNMRLFQSSFASPDLRQMVRDIELDQDELIREVLTRIGKDLKTFVQSYTNVMRPGDYRAQFGVFAYLTPPDRTKVEWSAFAKWWDIPRPAHPGGWADITGDLRLKYEVSVTKDGEADYTLTLQNTSDHAAFVEARHGFWVVTGVFDPGGRVDSIIRNTFDYLSRRYITGPRGGRRLGPPTADVLNLGGTGIEVVGTP